MTPAAPRDRGIAALSVRRPVGTLVLASVGIVLGLFFLDRLPIDLLPSITYPRIGVRINAPGMTPEVAVEEITRPLEEGLSATEGVVQVFSQTREGQVQVDLYFRPGDDIDQALNDATAAVNRARSSLPDTVEQPRIFKIDPSQLPIVEFALSSPTRPGRALRLFADEELARELAVVPGVASVDVSGGAREEVQVLVDLERLQSTGLGLTQVMEALAAENQDVSGGRLQGTREEPLVRTVGLFKEAREIEQIPFLVDTPAPAPAGEPPGNVDAESPVGRRVLLRDFAQVIDGVEDQRVFVKLNGESAVKISVQKQPDANTVEVVDAVRARIEELRRTGRLPEGTVVNATLDESRFIRRALKDVAVSGLTGAALAAVMILLFLGSIRQTLIVVLAIPLGTLLSVALLALTGASLNIFTLGGLAVGIGAVDSCVVVLENIVRGIENRRGTTDGVAVLAAPEMVPLASARSAELESALVASTTTNLAAIAPFLLIGGFVALLFSELILTVLFTVGASLVAALTVVPTLTARLLTIRRTSGLAGTRPVIWFRNRVSGLTARYERLLARAIARHWVVLGGIFAAIALLGAVTLPGLKTEILPPVGTGQARLIAQFPPGTPLATNVAIMGKAEEILRAQPETEYVFVTAGGFLFGAMTIANPLRGSASVTLKPGSDIDAFVTRANRQLAGLNLVGVRMRLAPEQIRGLITSNSPVRSAGVDVLLSGTDREALRRAGQLVLDALDEKASAARYRADADPAQTEIQVRLDQARASLLGVSSRSLGQTVQTAVEGSIPTRLQRGERLVDVRVRVEKDDLRTAAQLGQLPVFVGGGRQVRLTDVATIGEARTPAEVQRINQREVFIIAGDLTPGATLGEALEEVDRIVSAVPLPRGVVRLPSAAAESNRALRGSLATLTALAVFFVFAVMAVQYDSLLDPLVILFTVPLALVGGLVGLVVTGTALGATALIGAVLLVGVIVGNGIILVERANQLREVGGEGDGGGLSRAAAMNRAAPERLRPILITTLLATLGVLPMALGMGEGTELLRPLALVVLSGLAIGTVLTLFVVPCLYVAMYARAERRPAAQAANAGSRRAVP